MNIGIFYPEIKIGGGIASVIILLSGELVRRGYKVWIFTQDPPSSSDFSLPDGVQRIMMPPGREECLKAMTQVLPELNIDLCLFQDHWTEKSFQYMQRARELGCRTVVTVHITYFHPMYGKRLELFANRLAAFRDLDAVTCLSERDHLWWRASGCEQSVFIPNPSPFEPLSCGKATWGTPNVIFVGRLERQKGIWFLPKIFSRITDQFPEAQFTILGDFASRRDKKPFYTDLQHLGLQDRVHFKGVVPNVGEYFEQSSVLIMPSNHEGQPMTRLEAAAHGLPVVSFDMPYLELRTMDSGCVMVGKEDVEGMAAATVKLLRDQPFWKELSDNAIHSLQPFSLPKIVDRWEQLFTSIQRGSVALDFAPAGEDPEILTVTMKELHAGAKAYAEYVERELRAYTYLKPLHKTLSWLFPSTSKRRRAVAAAATFFRKKRE